MVGGARARIPACGLSVRNTVLVVEDEVLVRMAIADQLRSAGYLVVEAANAHDALDVLRHNGVHVGLVLSDIRMPGAMDGAGLARTVRSQYPGVKIVLTSGEPPEANCIDHDGFFPKPYSATNLIRHIAALLG